MKFTFKYESLKKIRRHRQEREQQKLAVMRGRKAKLQQELSALREELSAPVDESSRRHSVYQVRQTFQHHMKGLKRCWKMEKDLLRLEREIERQRQRLLEADREKKVLETLEAREKMRFVEKLQHREQLRQNEIATQMYNQRG